MNHLPSGNDEFEKNSDKKEELFHFADLAKKYTIQKLPGFSLLEDLINFKSEVNKKRVYKFMEDLYERIRLEFGDDFNFEDLNNESFSDLLELILNKVKNTKSEFKKDRFQDILLLQIKTISENYLFAKFVDLLDKLNEIQIVLLQQMASSEQFTFGVGLHKGYTIIDGFLIENSTNTKMNEFILSLKEYALKKKNDEIELYMLEMASFGLIKTFPQETQLGRSGSPKYVVTDICQKFLSFIIKK